MGAPPAEDWLDSPNVDMGTPELIAEKLQSYREHIDLSYFVMFGEHMEAFAPVVAELASR